MNTSDNSGNIDYSVKLSTEIHKLICSYFPNDPVKIVLVNEFTIGSFYNYKDKLPFAARSSLVYRFSCAACSASDYVGMTSRSLSARIAEHAGRSIRTGNPLSQPPHSNIRDHAHSCGSPISSEQFSILKHCNSSISDLKILESLFIFKTKPNLNSQNSSFPLSVANV